MPENNDPALSAEGAPVAPMTGMEFLRMLREDTVTERGFHRGLQTWIDDHSSVARVLAAFDDLNRLAALANAPRPDGSEPVEHTLVLPEGWRGSRVIRAYCTCGEVMPLDIKTGPEGWHAVHERTA